MIEHVEKHPAGTFARCPKCRGEARHVITRGRRAYEATVPMGPGGQRHHLECTRCIHRTKRHPMLEDAVTEWGGKQQLRLPLQVVRGRGKVAA